jgi:hypothetical protein
VLPVCVLLPARRSSTDERSQRLFSTQAVCVRLGAVDLMLMRLHQRQIEHQCRAALLALDVAQHGLNTSDHDVFWAGIQSFLTAAANISKTLWGSRGRRSQARAGLRRSLGVPEDSPLASTDLRNHLEHFDERLDRWHATSMSHNFVDFAIGPKGRTVVGLDETDMFRQFDPETGDIIFWGEVHPLMPIRDAISELLPTASVESAKPHWSE